MLFHSRKTSFLAGILAFLLLWSSYSQAANCLYSLAPSETEVLWTAFKTTKKVGVKGQFKSFYWAAPKEADSLQQAVLDSSFVIDTQSVSTGDSGRDLNLVNHFFKIFVGGSTIRGIPTSVKEGKTKTMEVLLFMNGTSVRVPFTFSIENDSVLTAEGKIDIMQFNGKKQMESINRACYELHKGEDGKSKTWSDVELKLVARFERTCER